MSLQALGMKNLSDTPSENIEPSPDTVWMKSDEERRVALTDICNGNCLQVCYSILQ